MKKLLIAIASAASIAGMAKAAALNTETGTSFTGNTVGVFDPGSADTDFISGEEPVGSPYWSVPQGADTTSLQIKKGGLPTVTRPTQWQGKDTDGTYLSIDISEKLTRKIDAVNDTAYNMGSVYFDSLVQFTATDTAPTPETGDKLIVWLKGTDAEGTEGQEGYVAAATNLVITAGKVDAEFNVEAKAYDISGLAIEPNTWHRLTIKTVASIGDNSPVPGFKVYIDGEQVASGDTTIFPSLVNYNAAALNPTTLTSVSFQGTGAVDDIVFTNKDPFPEVEPETFAISVTGANVTDYAFFADAEAEDEIDDATKLPLDTETIYVSVYAADGYTISAATFNGVAVTVPEKTPEIGDYYFELTIPEGVADGDTLVFAVTTTAGGDEPGDQDWKDPDDITAGQTAGDVYDITGELAAVDAKALTAWATGKGGVQFSEKGSINPECFLLDIANGSSAAEITAAEEEAEEKIGITQISFDENGDVKLTYPGTYKNGVVVVEGKAALTDKTWHDKTDGDQFFRTVLKLK